MKTPPSRLSLAAGALAAVIAAAAGSAWRHVPAAASPPTVAVTPAPPGQAGAAAAAPHAARSQPPMPAEVPAEVPTPGAMVHNHEPLKLQVARLLASGDPHDAYAAYYLVVACTSFNRHDLSLFDDKIKARRDMNAEERRNMSKQCGGMTERERQARLDYLALAVEGGVPAAALTYLFEGPLGDANALKTRPNDPLVQQWKAGALAQLTQAADAGDLVTLNAWGHQTLHGSDFVEKNELVGYGYLLAFGFIQAERNGPGDTGAAQYRDGSALMRMLAPGLTAEQRAAAVATARAIADRFKQRNRPAPALT